jgi:predicted DNA-binding antitoxin AbrB/MazE fold protein
MLKKAFYIVCVSLALFSCKSREEEPLANPIQIRAYFPISEFVVEQIQLLEGSKIEKELIVNEDLEQTTQRLDSASWRKELDWFIQMDINKASLATAYEVTEENGKTIHRLKEGEKASLKEMVVFREGQAVKEITLIAEESNTFYGSQTNARLTTDPATGVIDHYELESSQKVWFLDPNTLKVKSRVLREN